MASETLSNFLGSLDKPSKFKMRPVICEETDTLTLYLENEGSYAERVDKYLTLFKAFHTNELVGFELKGIVKMLKRLGGMITVNAATPKVHVELVIQCYLPAAKNDWDSYEKLINRVRGVDARIPLIPLASRNRRVAGTTMLV